MATLIPYDASEQTVANRIGANNLANRNSWLTGAVKGYSSTTGFVYSLESNTLYVSGQTVNSSISTLQGGYNYKIRHSSDFTMTCNFFDFAGESWVIFDFVAYRNLFSRYNLDYWLDLRFEFDHETIVALFESSSYMLTYNQYHSYSNTYAYEWLDGSWPGYSSPEIFEYENAEITHYTTTNHGSSRVLEHISPQKNPWGLGYMDSANGAVWSYTIGFNGSWAYQTDWIQNFSMNWSLRSTGSLSAISGYSAGYNDGYAKGIEDGGSIGELGGSFSLLGRAFESMSSVMSTQVIGGLTIGALVGIPLTLTLVITLLRMLRK